MAASVDNQRTRLFIGEGNFSYTRAITKKHPELAPKIIATELVETPSCQTCEHIEMAASFTDEPPSKCDNCEKRAKRIDRLRRKNVDIRFGIDGTKIHEQFSGGKFKHIHWNCPHDGNSFDKQTLPPLIGLFFKACRELQNPGNRVHITLAQPTEKKGFYQGYYYNIVKAAASAGYRLVKKRKFFNRFSPQGYSHTQTNAQVAAIVVDQTAREFIFERISTPLLRKAQKKSISPKDKTKVVIDKLALNLKGEKEYSVQTGTFYENPRCYYVCSTDDDSSSYSDISEDELTAKTESLKLEAKT